MPTPEDITDERLREELVSFAQLILLLERKEALLDRSASVLRLLGDLRRMVFAWEVRVTNRDGPPMPRRPGSAGPIDEDASERVVREALRREQELLEELGGDTPEEDAS
jgi:hypothetical protein